jgi:hypothetical protein
MAATAALADAEGPQQAPSAQQFLDVTLPTNAKVLLRGFLNPTPEFVRAGRAGTLSFDTFVASDPFTPEGFEFATFVVDPRNLGGIATLDITATCEGCAATEQSWIVGDADDVTPPVIADGAIGPPQPGSSGYEDVFGYRPAGWTINATAPPVSDDTGVLFIRTDTNEGRSALDSFTSETETLLSAPFDVGPVRVGCFTATAVDLAGNETSFGDEVCAEIGEDQRGFGCAATSTSSAAMIALCALLMRRMRAAT